MGIPKEGFVAEVGEGAGVGNGAGQSVEGDVEGGQELYSGEGRWDFSVQVVGGEVQRFQAPALAENVRDCTCRIYINVIPHMRDRSFEVVDKF